MKNKKKYVYVKNLLDFFISFIALILLSPILIILMILIKIDSPGPIFFKQNRVGIHKKNFNIHKFRTMKIDTPKDTPTHLLNNPDFYITRVGKVLRKTSLDELPQLIDVLIGKMSLIGPRPALYNQYDLIKERDKYGANDVRPGITGWAQINGRDELKISTKAKYDGDYVQNVNFFFDIKIFFLTFIKVFKHEGVVEGNTKNNKKNILVISQYYYPEPFRINDICEELVKEGYNVLVVTGMPNYPKGEIYEKYQHHKNYDEVINGVNIHRCYTIPRKKGIIYRFLNYYSFMFSSTKYVKKIEDKYESVFVYQLSPVMMANAAIKYKKKYNKKMTLYCLDIWPESLTVGNIKKNSLIYKYYHIISKKIYKEADNLIVSSQGFINYLHNNFNILKDKITYIPQYCEDIYDSDKCKKIDDKYIDLMFAGNIGKAQSIETIIKAANELKEQKKIRFHILGDGTELNNLKKLAYENFKLKNITFYGRKPLKDMPKYYAKADAMLVTFKNDEFLSLTLPGKVQAYMASKKPIIGATSGETKKTIELAKCGYCCDSEDYKELSENILKFSTITKKEKKDMGINAKKYYDKFFSKERVIKGIIKHINI